MGVTGTFKVGLGVLHVITPLDHKESRLIHNFFSVGRGLTPVIINKGALEPPLELLTKVEIRPLNPIHRILYLCYIKP